MVDYSHLDAIEMRLFHEERRLAVATKPNDIAFRQREIASAKRELAAERRFLGLPEEQASPSLDEILDDDLLMQLRA